MGGEEIGAALIGSTVSGITSAVAGKRSRAFNRREAAKSRTWQEYMAKTRYQRTMEDMKKAGLNPMLAYGQGGGSTPSGATATTQTTDTSKIASTGLEVYQKGLETRKLKDNLKTSADTRELLKAQKLKAESDSILSQTSAAEAAARTEMLMNKMPKAELFRDLWSLKDSIPDFNQLWKDHRAYKKAVPKLKHKPAGASGSSGQKNHWRSN